MAGYLFDYEQKVWGGEKIRLNPIYFRALRLFYFLKAIKDVKGKVLDVGCGVGDFVEAVHFYRPDLELFGVDISEKAVKIARDRIKVGKFAAADAEKLPFRANYFDAIMCFDVIEHVQYPKKAIAEAVRVLKKGGIYHAFIPTEGEIYTLEGLITKIGWKGKEIYGAHPRHYALKEIKQMFEESQLEIVKCRWGDHLVHQLGEIGHFSFLLLRKKNMKSSVEGYLSASKPGFKIQTLKVVKNIVATLANTETILFGAFFPGIGVHITSKKTK